MVSRRTPSAGLLPLATRDLLFAIPILFFCAGMDCLVLIVPSTWPPLREGLQSHSVLQPNRDLRLNHSSVPAPAQQERKLASRAGKGWPPMIQRQQAAWRSNDEFDGASGRTAFAIRRTPRKLAGSTHPRSP